MLRSTFSLCLSQSAILGTLSCVPVVQDCIVSRVENPSHFLVGLNFAQIHHLDLGKFLVVICILI